MKLDNFLQLFLKLNRYSSLFSAQISLTNRCNESCIHCLVCKKPAYELEIQKLKDVISELRALNCMEVAFTGGEPMLRKDFFDILYFTNKKALGIKFLSNGTLINETNIKELKKINLLNIQISLYGVTASTHDSITQIKGSFERTIQAIKLLKDNKIHFSIITMVMRHNFKELVLMRDMAKRNKWKILFDFIIRPSDSGSRAPLEHRITDAQIKKAIDLDLLPFVNKNKKLRYYDKQTLCVNNLGRRHVFISSQGKVFPDIFLKISIGDLRKDSLHNIWYKSKKLYWLRNLTLSDFECSQCKYLFRCCWDPDLALAEHNDLFKRPQELCRFIKYISCEDVQ